MAKHGRRANETGRSEGEPRFLQTPYWVMETPAWLSISANCKVTLLAVAKRFNGRNNGKIAFGVRSGIFVPIGGRELAERPFGLSRFQIGRALAEAEAAGFLVCTQDATFGQKRLMREWRLTWLSCGDKPPTKEFVALLRPVSSQARSTGAHAPHQQEHQCTSGTAKQGLTGAPALLWTKRIGAPVLTI